jgi:hypothetical protein
MHDKVTGDTCRITLWYRIPYSALCKTFELCENTTKRTEITTYMVKLFKQVIELTPDGLLELLYLCINKVIMIHVCLIKVFCFI